MTNQHSITPPPELATHWLELWNNMPVPRPVTIQWIATQAARWGADQELEACCEWTRLSSSDGTEESLRVTRRPKSPSLKEQALTALREAETSGHLYVNGRSDTIRKALEALPND